MRHQLKSSTSFGGGKEHAAGLLLRAEDVGLSTGDGPAVSGTALALLLALSGRAAALAELVGPGTAVLADRLERPG